MNYNKQFNKWFDAEYPRDDWDDAGGSRDDFKKALRHAYLRGVYDGADPCRYEEDD